MDMAANVRVNAALVLVIVTSCTTVRGDDPFASADASWSAGATGSDDGAESSTGAAATSRADATDDDQDASVGTKWDMPLPPDFDPDGRAQGCEKVDFLFVVDRSSSMSDEQDNLVASFPGFIDALQQTLAANDFHILVTDTDGPSMNCYEACQSSPALISCQSVPCGQHPEPGTCDATLGAGLVKDNALAPCGYPEGARYLTQDHPDLHGTFACAAEVGVGGDINEQQAAALLAAVSDEQAGPGACNEAFLRDDAVLVVTFITDEEDKVSTGDPASWRQALVQAKGGNEDAIVILGLIGDPEQPGTACTGDDWWAEEAPKLRSFVESFTHSMWASVCEPDYAPFFEQAIGLIDTTCDAFEPVG
jgi:hypothetical protein